jgi:hypothetical protein
MRFLCIVELHMSRPTIRITESGAMERQQLVPFCITFEIHMSSAI